MHDMHLSAALWHRCCAADHALFWPATTAAAVMSRPLAEACNDRVISVILG